MITDNLLNILSFFHLGRRYMRTLDSNRKAIRKRRSEYYIQSWKDAASQTGSEFKLLGNGICRITNGSRNILVYEQYTPLVDTVSYRLVVNKGIVYELLNEIDVPMPRYLHLKKLDLSAAKTFLSEFDGPVVVKPAYGTGAGAGVTTNVEGTCRLFQALAWSRAFCPETILEEQVKGENYRLLFLDGELLDCIVRKPPTVTGDGISSIRRLIRRENRKRIEPGSQLAQSLIYADLDTKNTLAAQGLSLRSKPANGQVIKLKDVINCNRAEENETPPHDPPDTTLELGRRITEVTGVRLLGIDIITEDLKADLGVSDGKIIEINTPPGHFYHHLKKGDGYQVGLHLLHKVLSE